MLREWLAQRVESNQVSATAVAIVEDEFLVALQLEDILCDAGCHVVATAPDLMAAEAINQSVDVALVDLNLRDGLTGPEIARRLGARFGTRIIYVTANPEQIGTPADTAIGVLNKPFSRTAVEAALAYAMDETLTVARPAELHPLERHSICQSA